MFQSQKILSHKKVLVTKKISQNFFFNHKKILVTKFFQSQNNFTHKKKLDTKNLQSQRILVKNKMNFGHAKSFSQK